MQVFMLFNSSGPEKYCADFCVAGLAINTAVQIIRKSWSKIRLLFLSLYTLYLAYLSDLLDVRYMLDKQCPTSKFWTFLISCRPRPLDHTAHALNKDTLGCNYWSSRFKTHLDTSNASSYGPNECRTRLSRETRLNSHVKIVYKK